MTDFGKDWLTSLVLGFNTCAELSDPQSPDARNWFRQSAADAKRVLSDLDSAPRDYATKPLVIEAINPQWGRKRRKYDAYVSMEATLSKGTLHSCSTKIGVLRTRRGRKAIVLRVLFDYDHSKTSTTSSFPSHVQWGKNPGEFSGLQTLYYLPPDEPRIPCVPLDFFHVLQLVHEQFGGPQITKNLQSKTFRDVLMTWSRLMSEPWLERANRPQSMNMLARLRTVAPFGQG